MNSSLLLLLSAIMAPWLGPNVHIDHGDMQTHRMFAPAITLGPQTSSGQSVYVVFQDDSMYGMVARRSDIMLQKSTDAGRTWLPADVIVRRGGPSATDPDITTDLYGNIYVVYQANSASSYYVYCVHSTDGGATWSPPTRVVDIDRACGARIAADSAGNLFCAWGDRRTGWGRIWSSVSTDRGMTWSPNVRVDDDTVSSDCYHPDVFVQPVTNHYLVVATAPRHGGPGITSGCHLYRSDDMGRTFQPGVRVDTFGGGYASQPHVVADPQHIICDYTGFSGLSDHDATEARTLYIPPDTWGNPRWVSDPDTLYESYYNGAKLAISADGRVHTALMICNTTDWYYHTYYTFSSDHGVSWSERKLVDDDSTAESWDPDIAADSAGHAYVVWRKGYSDSRGIWFATNSPAGIAEREQQQPVGVQPSAMALFCGSSYGVLVEYELTAPARVRASLYDAVGRQVGVFDAGEQKPSIHRLSWNQDCEGRKLSAGAYFVLLDMGKEQAELKAVVR